MNADSFTLTVRQTATGPRWDYVLRGPNGYRFDGTNGHACAKQAAYSAQRGMTRRLRFDGMEDGSTLDLSCDVHKGARMADLHMHTHAITLQVAS